MNQTGSTLYGNGQTVLSGPSGTVVITYATGLPPNQPFQLVSTVADTVHRSKRCTRDPIPMNPTVRTSSPSGGIGRTLGAINRPPGVYDVCFKSTTGTLVSSPLRFTVT